MCACRPAAGSPALLALCTAAGFNSVVFYFVVGAVRGVGILLPGSVLTTPP
jgi:hypothetical protein